MEIYNLYTDGGSRGNPGHAAYGCVLYDEKGLLVDLDAGYLGETTNNQAEYQGIISGLKMAKKNKVKNITCYLDSQLIVRQINGEYKVKNSGIKPFFEKLKKITNDFDTISFYHVYREKNKVADKLGNLILDAICK